VIKCDVCKQNSETPGGIHTEHTDVCSPKCAADYIEKVDKHILRLLNVIEPRLRELEKDVKVLKK